MDLPAVDFIKNLAHDKHVEKHSQVLSSCQVDHQRTKLLNDTI
jgi:hypothetical protein